MIKKGGLEMELVLQTNELTKVYRKQAVVDQVSLNVRRGDIYGFVGKNGAGKTTLIRMILGLTPISDGSFSLLSGSLREARKKTGSLVESPALYPNMSARDNLRLYCALLGQSKSKADELLEKVGLENTGKKYAQDFSLGMKQRLGIAMALAGDPEFLMLDEPINGLDPTGIVEIRELLLALKDEGKTIFISSHILGELEKIATRYGIISAGKLIEEIDAEELAAKCADHTVLRTGDPQAALELIRGIYGDERVSSGNDGSVRIAGDIGDIGELTNKLFQSGITVSGISTDESGAEKYFIRKMEEG